MKKPLAYILIVLLVLWSADLFAACGGSTPNWTATNLTDAAACQADAGFQAGDTITVTGNSTVDTGGNLTITKQLNLIGASTPVLTRGTLAAGTAMITVTLAADIDVRISGFRFENGTNDVSEKGAIYINGKTDGSLLLTKIRIDNNYFNKGRHAVWANGAVYGVINSNTFVNCDIAVMVSGDNNYAWNRTIEAGTANALFIEGNTFSATEAGRDRNLNQQIYHQAGGRSVTRYNTFDMTAVTGSGAAGFFDSHGNQGGCATPFDTFRGQPILEVYGNKFQAGDAASISGYAAIDIRGGSSLIYNNEFYTASGGGLYAIRLWEEEEWTSGNFAGPCTAWPSDDQIFNSFFWNNRTYWNGTSTPTTLTDVDKHSNNSSGTYIVKDRDYFMAAPAASGGKETLSSVATYGSITGSKYGDAMTFSASGANAYNPYSAAACPDTRTGLAGSCTSEVGTTGYNASTVRTVTPSTSTGCTISPDTAQTVTDGNTLVFTMTAAYGYSITATGCTLSGSTCTTAAVSGDLSVSCNPKPHFATLGGSGTVTLGGSGTITLGQ